MNKPFALIFGIICVAVGLVMFTNSPRHFNDDADYRRSKTYGHRPVSSEVVSGTQLNLEEPANNQGIRIAGDLSTTQAENCVVEHSRYRCRCSVRHLGDDYSVLV